MHQNRNKVAIIHDWIINRRGGEKVLECLLNQYPDAHLYYLFGDPTIYLKLPFKIENKFPSILNKLPFISYYYKLLLPFFPFIIEQFHLNDYDLILSSSHCVAKGIIPPPHAKHICYLHSPMRYAWDQENTYFPKPKGFWQWLFYGLVYLNMKYFLYWLRLWDVTSAVRCDQFIANSTFIQRRCKLYYGKESTVIHPPIFIPNTPFKPKPHKENSLLIFGAWVPYKKNLWALEALAQKEHTIHAGGHGSEFKKAHKKYKSHANIHFHKNPSDGEVANLYGQCKILVFPGLEDFGMVPWEALSRGVFVVAAHGGGLKDLFIPGVMGLFFEPGSAESLNNAVEQVLSWEFSPTVETAVQKQLQTLTPQYFNAQMEKVIQNSHENP